ncbi:Ovarian cancer-associated protein 2 [Coemansia sp. RSA 1813]|nr:Ovarian cancer-associated protein 2 [Coemansia sp. RSA 1646]KAJ1769649.1 Ovarian cancer-associated protein 2 [Coemansia sp. RSA 1843]KAJ2087298.1 Ovarian cancer-associated protein 2 [Coemansia sp. RSA 986]KAJ2212151.1 Ovarian cancer-associated protein 2 [Coemansia sp. RSA 487]KAJ2566163.1 Ovarian cancer-associated protein 2 [Coemansia sp. RSA 1813]
MYRVLCLHGYTQNAKKFRDRTGPFRRNMKRRMEMVYITAPIEATEFQNTDEELVEDEGLSSAAWWNRGDPKQPAWEGIKQSTQAVVQAMKEHGPFDGIVGFSQGAGMAAIIAALMHASQSQDTAYDSDVRALIDSVRPLQALKFAFFFAGFYPDVPQFDALIKGAGRIVVPSLHMLGRTDLVVPMARGRELADRAFAGDAAVVMEHEGGHFVPCNAAWRTRYQEFLDSIATAGTKS